MKILLIGKNGQLGWELQRSLATLGLITAVDFPEINLADEDGVRRMVEEVRPDVIVNPAAYTAVDKAETEPELAFAINGRAPGQLAELAKKMEACLVHYSTDYVFDGALGHDYCETDAPNPLGVYGQSKLAGDQAIQQVGGAYLILRTSWVYSTRQGGFVNKVLQWSRQQEVMRVVSDQVANPTWCRVLAEATAQTLAMGVQDPAAWIGERKGLYHLAGSGRASRLEWSKMILELDPQRSEQTVKELKPALTSDFPTPARRPLHSALNCDRFTDTFGLRLPPWQDVLRLALQAG